MTGRRILFHHRIRANDGQAVHVRELIHALRSQGHEVLECALVPKADTDPAATRNDPAATRNDPTATRNDPAATRNDPTATRNDPDSARNGPDSARNGQVAAPRPGLWQRLHLPRPVVEVMEMAYSRRGLSMLLKVARRFQPDFVYERHALHCRAGLLAARHLGVPLLLEANAPLVDEMAGLGRLWFPRSARRCERQVLGEADRVLPVSDVLAERLLALGADRDRLRVVRNGADPARHDDAARRQGQVLRRELGLRPGDLVVGFLGYMRAWHRLDLALAAMADPALGHMHLVLAGDGPALPEAQAKATELGVLDRLHVLGAVPPGRVPAVCAAFDVALVPAINEYASPLKVFDSLAAGVLTLAPDQPNLRELVQDGETAVLFPPDDPAGLARALLEIARDPARASRIGAAGRQLLLDRDWTWAGAARRVLAAFGEVVA